MLPRSMSFFSLTLATVLALFLAPVTANADQRAATQSILHSLDYLAVDYPQAVINGEIITSSEYREQQEFATAVQSLVATLPNHCTSRCWSTGSNPLPQFINRYYLRISC